MTLKLFNASAQIGDRLRLMDPWGSLATDGKGNYILVQNGAYDNSEGYLIKSIHSVGSVELVRLSPLDGHRCNISTFGEVNINIEDEGGLEIRLENKGARVIVDGYERGKFEAKKER